MSADQTGESMQGKELETIRGFVLSEKTQMLILAGKPGFKIDGTLNENDMGVKIGGVMSVVNPRHKHLRADNSASSSTSPASAVREIEP